MKKRISSNTVHHFIRAILLLGLAIYIFQLSISGDILQYVVPQIVIYIGIADFILFIVAAFQLYIAILSLKKPVILCECGHDHDHGSVFGHHHSEENKSKLINTFIYSLFLLPILLAFIPNQTLASSLVNNRGMNLGGLAAYSNSKGAAVQLDGNEDPALKKLFKTNVYDQGYAKLGMKLYKENVIEMKDKWFIEKLQSMNTFVDNFQDKEIKIKGFIYREAGLPSDQFIIARMGMTHCIADISPFGIVAESNNAAQFANDSWVTISGKISKTVVNGQTVIKIDVTNSEPAHAPKVPYVYPDWDFASKL